MLDYKTFLDLTSTDQKLPQGVFAAGLSPLCEDLSVNNEELLRHYKWLLANGCDGIVFMGTTGEANSFSVRERKEALEALIEGGLPAHRILAGTGCCALTDTVALTKHAVQIGVGGVLMLPPFYYKNISDEGLFRSFEHVINRVNERELRIYLYHFPQMSSIPFSFELIKKLLHVFPGIFQGIKDSSGDWSHMRSLIEHFPEINVFAGSERFLSDILSIGGAGCISASANVTCPLAGEIYHNRDLEKTDEWQSKLSELRSRIERHPMIPALKYVMARLTQNAEWLHMRPPQAPLHLEQKIMLDKTIPSLHEIGTGF